MTLEMRELQADDLFTVLQIADKLQIADEVVALIKQQEEGKDLTTKKNLLAVVIAKNPDSKEGKQAQKDLEKVTVELNDRSFDVIGGVIKLVLRNINNAKKDINQLLADLTNKKVEEIEKMNMIYYMRLLKDFFGKEELKEVFTMFTSANSSVEETSEKE